MAAIMGPPTLEDLAFWMEMQRDAKRFTYKHWHRRFSQRDNETDEYMMLRRVYESLRPTPRRFVNMPDIYDLLRNS